MTKNIYFPIIPNLLPKTDPRYQKWLISLKRRPPPWNKGKTRDTDPSVLKISKTFKRLKLDNFATWRKKMIAMGKIKNSYPAFKKSEELAFLIGMILGDGHIEVFPRTERLLISLNTKYPELINYVANVMSNVFEKQAKIEKIKFENCARVGLYKKYISKRLQLASGNRRYDQTGLPKWIWRSNKWIIYALKGLFEAEGSFSIHLPTCTYNFSFSNKNTNLLNQVERGLVILGFHPERRNVAVRLRKRHETLAFEALISFRKYTLI